MILCGECQFIPNFNNYSIINVRTRTDRALMKLDVYNCIVKEVSKLVDEQTPLTLPVYEELMRKLLQAIPQQGTNSKPPLSKSPPPPPPPPPTTTWKSYQLLDDVDMDATLSIYLQCHKKHIKKTAHVHKTPQNIQIYLTRLLTNRESIVALAKSLHFPPYMLVRYLIKHGNLFNDKRKKLVGTAAHTIDDPRIRRAIQQAAAADTYCSPAADIVRLNVGIEYEYILQQKLQQLGIAFQSEDQMRDEGRSKTPDIRLIVPIAIVDEQNKSVHVINWIDSKAMFGDPYTHNENKNQLQGYVNRYGPGMVIYWFDFVDVLNNDVDILMCKDFPSEFLQAV